MSILQEILATKAGEVEAAQRRRPLAEVARAARAAGPTRGFAAALRRPAGAPIRAIAEVKRASPSAGPIRMDARVEEVAREYAEAGAAAVSILTDESYFGGALDFLGRARAAVTLPLLRKDFIIDPYQLFEARAAGADAALLIVAALAPAQLADLVALANDLQMDALVEVHDADELEIARAAGARAIGVNHRNLGDFSIDMTLTARLRALVPPEVIFVAESGIRNRADVDRLAEDGADAVLVGESLMRAPSPGSALRDLLGGPT